MIRKDNVLAAQRIQYNLDIKSKQQQFIYLLGTACHQIYNSSQFLWVQPFREDHQPGEIKEFIYKNIIATNNIRCKRTKHTKPF